VVCVVSVCVVCNMLCGLCVVCVCGMCVLEIVWYLYVCVLCSKEYTELYQKDVHNPDNHEGMITHLEPDILECEVKWALASITTNKANGSVSSVQSLCHVRLFATP